MGITAQTLHEKTEAQRGYVTCLRSHGGAVGLLGLKLGSESFQRPTQPDAGLGNRGRIPARPRSLSNLGTQPLDSLALVKRALREMIPKAFSSFNALVRG